MAWLEYSIIQYSDENPIKNEIGDNKSSSLTLTSANISKSTNEYQNSTVRLCNRGFSIDYDDDNVVCFCPPAFYSARCEYWPGVKFWFRRNQNLRTDPSVVIFWIFLTGFIVDVRMDIMEMIVGYWKENVHFIAHQINCINTVNHLDYNTVGSSLKKSKYFNLFLYVEVRWSRLKSCEFLTTH